MEQNQLKQVCQEKISKNKSSYYQFKKKKQKTNLH